MHRYPLSVLFEVVERVRSSSLERCHVAGDLLCGAESVDFARFGALSAEPLAQILAALGAASTLREVRFGRANALECTSVMQLQAAMSASSVTPSPAAHCILTF